MRLQKDHIILSLLHIAHRAFFFWVQSMICTRSYICTTIFVRPIPISVLLSGGPFGLDDTKLILCIQSQILWTLNTLRTCMSEKQ
jgi:hypothetical protein